MGHLQVTSEFFDPIMLAFFRQRPSHCSVTCFGMAASIAGGGRHMKVPPGGTTYESSLSRSLCMYVLLRMKNNGDRE